MNLTTLRTRAFIIVFSASISMLHGQNAIITSVVNGNFQADAQFYLTDSAIGAYTVPEKMLMNTWTNLNYASGNFGAGLRFESYLNPINGYDPRYKGTGIPYWYVNYHAGNTEITAGHVYDQFGSGLIFRTYQEQNLAFDNSLYGVRMKFTPVKGIDIKGIYGRQRYFWEQGPGIVRGADADLNVTALFKQTDNGRWQVQAGGSFVSKFEENQQIQDAAGNELILPLNVAAAAGRLNITYGDVSLGTEYVQKINDPNTRNNFIYRKGEALLLTATYSHSNFGAFVQAKRLDNMSFKSKRTETGNVLDINYLPAISKQYSYSLAGHYPYASQPNGEMGVEAQLNYRIKKGTALGGKYGTEVALNLCAVNSIEKTRISDSIPILAAGTAGYNSPFFKPGNETYFRDFNIEITRRFSKSIKAIFNYLYQDYNIAVIEGHAGEPTVHAHIVVADVTYKFTPEKALRFETQALFTRQDHGNAMALMLEYTIAPQWFFSIYDEWYYTDKSGDTKPSYPMAAIAYNKDANRIQLSVGKQREGIICVGGVCRNVPAASGITLSVTSSF